MKRILLYVSVAICVFLLVITICFASTEESSSPITNNTASTATRATFDENTTKLSTDELKDLLNKVEGLYKKGNAEAEKYWKMNDPEKFGEARKEFILPILDAYKLLMDNNIPGDEDRLEFPLVWAFDILPNGSPSWHAAMRDYEQQMLIRQKAEIFDNLIVVKYRLERQIPGYYHSKPYRIEEFRLLLKDKLKDEAYINKFMLGMDDVIASEELEKKVNSQPWKKALNGEKQTAEKLRDTAQ